MEVVGVVPLAETPRQTIINRLFCLMRLPLSYYRKAKRSLPFAAPTLNSDHDNLYRQTKIPLVRDILFVVEVVGVEPTSYAAAKKLSTYLVYLLFLMFSTRVNTL